MTDDSRVAAEKSLVSSRCEPAAACSLMRGSIAVITETPTIAYGSWNSCHALLKAAKPAPAHVRQTRAPAALDTMVIARNDS